MDYEPIGGFDEARARELHGLYQQAWWSLGRTLDQTLRILDNSDFLFGYRAISTDRLVAFARVLSDRTIKAVIFDVIVDPGHRGAGLGKLLMQDILGHPGLARVKHFDLMCLPELVPFYRSLGFKDDLGGVLLMRRAVPPAS